MLNKATSKKMLLIGLEGATFNQINKLLRSKKLPFFSRLLNSGLHGKINSTYPVNRANSWASFFSGKHPGAHNLFDFLDHHNDPGAPELQMANDDEHHWMWDVTTRAGLKSIFFNVPILNAPKPVNGILISGFATPDGEKIAFPDSLNNRIQKQVDAIEVGLPKGKNKEDYFQTALEIVEKKFRLFRQLLDDQEWDLAFFSTNILDRIQPLFWNEEDKIEQTYFRLDALLEMLEQSLPEDVSIIVFSNFGYSPVSKKFFVNEWLWEQGWQQRKISTEKTFISDIDEYLSIHSNGNGRIIPELLAKSGITKNNIRSALPNNVSEILNRAIPRSLKKIFHTEYLNIAWSKSKAFFLSQNLQGIRLNVKGREPFGVVRPGREYEQLRNQITSELYHLKDPYTFEHVFEDVYKREDVFRGKYVTSAPDIMLVPRRNSYFLHPQKRTSRLCIGSANDENPKFAQRDNSGILMMKSPDNALVGKLGKIDIVDILPTILAFFQIHEREQFDGVVRKQLLGGTGIFTRENAQPDFVPAENFDRASPVNSAQKNERPTIFP